MIYAPAASATVLTCGASGEAAWASASSSFTVVRQCTLTLPEDEWVFMGADASLYRTGGDFEAQFQLGLDPAGGAANESRLVNVYADSGDGTDKPVALSRLAPLRKGAHTVYLIGRRYSGPGSVTAIDPTLSVLALGVHWPRVGLPVVLRN